MPKVEMAATVAFIFAIISLFSHETVSIANVNKQW